MIPLRIASIVGTRPEAIKLAPFARAAAGRPGVAHRLIATGQHGDICHEALADFGLQADVTLAADTAGSLDAREAALERAVADHLAADPPGLVIVQGDTSSALAGARAAAGLGIAIGHVEAGLRSHDLTRPFPEERNRVEIDRLSTLLFAPTPEAAANLACEPAVRGDVFITGNTGIDALLAMRPPPIVRDAADGHLILVTCHRRENIGAGIAGICAAIRRLAARRDVRVLLPLHPNPQVREPIGAALGTLANVDLCAPLSYPDMVRAMAEARLILTDSGGIQEEATALGTPVLVLRETTERPEGVAQGNLALVGTAADRIVAAASRMLDDDAAHAAMARPALPFGDGRPAPRILDACMTWGGQSRH